LRASPNLDLGHDYFGQESKKKMKERRLRLPASLHPKLARYPPPGPTFVV